MVVTQFMPQPILDLGGRQTVQHLTMQIDAVDAVEPATQLQRGGVEVFVAGDVHRHAPIGQTELR